MKLSRKQRERIKREIEKQREELEAQFGKIQKRRDPFAEPFDPFSAYTHNRCNEISKFKSVRTDPPKPEKRLHYEGEMAEREAAAQKEIERKKLRVAPYCNKGGYMYITDETDTSEIGRKL